MGNSVAAEKMTSLDAEGQGVLAYERSFRAGVERLPPVEPLTARARLLAAWQSGTGSGAYLRSHQPYYVAVGSQVVRPFLMTPYRGVIPVAVPVAARVVQTAGRVHHER